MINSKPFLILLLTFAIPSGNLSSADRGQNLPGTSASSGQGEFGKEWKTIGKDIKQGAKGWVDEMMKYPKALSDNMRLIVPEDPNAYLSDFKIGGAVSLPSGAGFTGSLKEEGSLDITVPPILGCDALNAIASVKKSFDKEAISNAPRKLMNFAAAAAKSLIGFIPMFALAMASPATYEFLTHELGISLTGFFSGEFPSCQDMQASLDEYLAEKAERDPEGKTMPDGQIAVEKIAQKSSALHGAEIFLKHSGKKERTYPPTDDKGESLFSEENKEKEKEKGLPSVNDQGKNVRQGGKDQEELDAAKSIVNIFSQVLSKATNVQITTINNFWSPQGPFPGKDGKPDPKALYKAITTFFGNQKYKYNDNKPTKMDITTQPALGVESVASAIYEETIVITYETLKTLAKDQRPATQEDVRKIIAITPGALAFPTKLLDIFVQGMREEDVEVMWQAHVFTRNVAKLRVISKVSAVQTVMKIATKTQVATDNELIGNYGSAALAVMEGWAAYTSPEALDKAMGEFLELNQTVFWRKREKEQEYRKPM